MFAHRDQLIELDFAEVLVTGGIVGERRVRGCKGTQWTGRGIADLRFRVDDAGDVPVFGSIPSLVAAEGRRPEGDAIDRDIEW